MAGWFNTAVPTGMAHIIEKSSPLQALSRGMSELNDIVDNRAKENYTTNALESLKGAKSMQDVFNLGLDMSKMTKTGQIQYNQNVNMIDKINQEQRANTLFDWKKEDRQFTLDNRARDEATKGILSQLETMNPEEKKLMFANLDPKYVDAYQIRNADIARQDAIKAARQRDITFGNQQTVFNQGQQDRVDERLSINAFKQADADQNGILDNNERTVFEQFAGTNNKFASQTIQNNAVKFKAIQDDGKIKLNTAKAKYEEMVNKLLIERRQASDEYDKAKVRTIDAQLLTLKQNYSDTIKNVSDLYFLPLQKAEAITEDAKAVNDEVNKTSPVNGNKIEILDKAKYSPVPMQKEDDGTMETPEEANARAQKNQMELKTRSLVTNMTTAVNAANTKSAIGDIENNKYAEQILFNAVIPEATKSESNMNLFFAGINGKSPFDSMSPVTKSIALKNHILLDKYIDMNSKGIMQLLKSNQGAKALEYLNAMKSVAKQNGGTNVILNKEIDRLSNIISPKYEYNKIEQEFKSLPEDKQYLIHSLGKKIGEWEIDPSMLKQDASTLEKKYLPEIARQYKIITGQDFTINQLANFMQDNSREQKMSDKFSFINGKSTGGEIFDFLTTPLPKRMPNTAPNRVWKNNATLDPMYKAIYQGVVYSVSKHAKFDKSGNPANESAKKLVEQYEALKADPEMTWLKSWYETLPGIVHKPTTAEKDALKTSATRGLF